jgi:hypothetical protein
MQSISSFAALVSRHVGLAERHEAYAGPVRDYLFPVRAKSGSLRILNAVIIHDDYSYPGFVTRSMVERFCEIRELPS